MASGKPTGGDIKIGSYNVNMLDELGRGTFGNVYKGIHDRTGGVVAIKKIQIKDNKAGSEGMEEIKKFEKIALHKNVVRLLDFHYHDTSFWMVMEFCDLKDIDDYMKTHDTDLDMRYKFVTECAEALCHMHNQVIPIVHRDIKPGNILLKSSDGEPTVKLADFGLSKMVDVEDMMKTAIFSTAVGTPGFMAPELYEKKPYNQGVDVFAMGLVFLAIVQHKKGGQLAPESSGTPMPIGLEMTMFSKQPGPMHDYAKINPNDPPRVKTIKEAAKQMICYEPKARISMNQVVQIICGSKEGSALAAGGGGEPEMLLSRHTRPNPNPSSNALRSFVSSSTTEDDDDDLGMALLRQALESSVARIAETVSDGGAVEARRERESTMELFRQAFNQDKFEVGERARIEEDIGKVRQLQKGHGGWNEKMADYVDRVGVVMAVRQRQIDVGFSDGRKWSFNPALVHKLDEEMTEKGAGSSRRLKAMGKFRANNIVKVTSDVNELERLQREAGIWKDWLKRIAGIKGIVHKVDSDGDVVVEILTGEKVYLHCDTLIHVSQDGLEVESGDLVFVINDVDLVRRNQQGHGGWNDDMRGLIGRATTVKKVLGGNAILEDEGRRWSFNVRSLLVVAKNRELMSAILAKKQGNEDGGVPCRVQ